MDNIERKINDIIIQIKSKFNIKPRRKITKIELEEKDIFNERGERKNILLEGEILKIRKSDSEPFFHEFLISEISKLFFPEILLTNYHSIDFGYYIAFRLSDNKKRWLEKWREISKYIYIKNLAYRPDYDLIEIDKVTDSKGIRIIFDFFVNVGKFKENINLEEFLFFFDALQKSIIVKLSPNEYRILLEIQNYNEPKLDIIQKKLKMKTNIFLKNYSKLKRHIWLNYLPFINWPKIGLECFIIIINPFIKYTELVKNKLMKPYIRVIHQVGGGLGSRLILTTALPLGSIHTVEKYLRELCSEGFIDYYNIMRAISYNHTINLKSFDLKTNQWLINNQDIREYLKLQESNYGNITNGKISFDYTPRKLEFDSFDLKLLLEIEKPPGIDISKSYLSKKLGKSKKSIKERLHRLKENGFYVTYPVFYPILINLPETIISFINCKESDIFKKILSLSSSLPNNYFLELESKFSVFSINSLPGNLNYLTKNIIREIMKLKDEIEINLFFEHINYQTVHISSDLFSDNEWADPAEIWF